MTIELGVCDSGCVPSDLTQYFKPIHEKSMAAQAQLRGKGEGQWIPFTEGLSAAKDILGALAFGG